MDPANSSIRRILQNPALVDEIARRLEAAREAAPLEPSALRDAVRALADGRESSLSSVEEAIIRREGRPVYFIRNDRIDGAEQGFWACRISEARANLEHAIPAVGSIRLARHARRRAAGTGWLVAPDVVVTNRHVAREFAQARDGGFVLDVDPFGQSAVVSMDFAVEHEAPRQRVFKIVGVLHIEEGGSRPDVALLKLAARDEARQPAAEHIRLSDADPTEGTVVAVIGYAAYDDRNDEEVMASIFGGIYGVKRLHPGELLAPVGQALTHDCSTLGGNSGSVVLDFASGRAVGLHYAGYYERENFAVKASALAEILHRFKILEY